MRVLVVEDEPRIADFIARGLTENGYSVATAADGVEAEEWPSVAEFDVKILDVMLPELSGRKYAAGCAKTACTRRY